MTPAGVTGDQIINNYPRYILVAPGTRAIEARKIIAQTTPAQASQVNPYANAFDVIEEPRLFNTAGAQRPERRGVQTKELGWRPIPRPSTRSNTAASKPSPSPSSISQVGFEVDGVEFKIRHDFAQRSLHDRSST